MKDNKGAAAAARTSGDRPGALGNKAGPPAQPSRPAAERSRDAKQRASAILEVLAGARTPADAARALGVSVPRYYHLEEQALAALVAACEPQPRGPGPDHARRYAALERECQRWQRECVRQQALVRAAHRTIGLTAPPPPAAKDPGKKRRRRRPVVRALQAVARLRDAPDGPAAAENTAAGASTAAPAES
jgi:hypothetical protein